MKIRANIRPVLLGQGEPGTPQHDLMNHLLCYMVKGLLGQGQYISSTLLSNSKLDLTQKETKELCTIGCVVCFV